MTKDKLQIEYFSDVLCVWAWIAQRRVEEMEEEWGDRVSSNYLCINVFGDTQKKFAEGWSDRGGFEGYAKHVAEAAEPFELAVVNPRVWSVVRPMSSAIPHLVVKAAALVEGTAREYELALQLRRAFFEDARDIGQLDVAMEVAVQTGFQSNDLNAVIDDGRAHAQLMSDYDLAQKMSIRGSPSWVLNEGRQIIYGNVGYRVISANIRELIKRPSEEASWC
jgi:predicted DsbA family dithiol-disulfide isomerase